MIVNKFPLRQDVVLEVLQKTSVELAKELGAESVEKLNHLVDYTVGLLKIFAHEELFEKGKYPCVLVALKELVRSYLRNSHGNTLLHLAVDCQHRMNFYRLLVRSPSQFSFPCAKTTKLLLQMGFNVNAVNSNGDTPLLKAATFKPVANTGRKIDLHGRQNSSEYEVKTGFVLLWSYLLQIKFCIYTIFTHQAKTVMAACAFYSLHQANVMFKNRFVTHFHAY